MKSPPICVLQKRDLWSEEKRKEDDNSRDLKNKKGRVSGKPGSAFWTGEENDLFYIPLCGALGGEGTSNSTRKKKGLDPWGGGKKGPTSNKKRRKRPGLSESGGGPNERGRRSFLLRKKHKRETKEKKEAFCNKEKRGGRPVPCNGRCSEENHNRHS